jgi:aminoacylase
MDDNLSIQFFKDLLKIRTISGEGPFTGTYLKCCELLQSELVKIGFHCELKEFITNKPVLIATLLGKDPQLPSILLNAHYDDVPAQLDKWTKDPFSAIEDADGKIFARGTQDMKCVCAQYVCALSRLLQKDKAFLRTLHVTFVPDEEIGGMDGMNQLINSSLFQQKMLPIALALDEGLANPMNSFTVFYGERCPLWIFVTVNGPTGHGSRFVEGTAMERLMKICNKALDFRKKEEEIFRGKRASEGCSHCEAKKLGDVTTLNITFVNAGVPMNTDKLEFVEGEPKVALNVIPTSAKAGMDIRIPPHVTVSSIAAMLDEWCDEENASWRCAPWTDQSLKEHSSTSIDRNENPFWGVFQDAIAEFGVKLEPEVFPAGTDSRFIRQVGIPAFGFSPIRNTPVLLHEHDEWIERKVFLEGIQVYETLLPSLLNFPATSKEKQNGSEQKRVKM